jgi:hypothetical protein
MSDAVLIDAVGRRRSKVTLPATWRGRPRTTRACAQDPADPRRAEEIIAVMRMCDDSLRLLLPRGLGAGARNVIGAAWPGHGGAASLGRRGAAWLV